MCQDFSLLAYIKTYSGQFKEDQITNSTFSLRAETACWANDCLQSRVHYKLLLQ